MTEGLPATIGNRYQILRSFGSGGMGTVFLARDDSLNRNVAIKVCHELSAPSSLERFRREARAMARIVHPHIVRVLDWNTDSRPRFLVMEVIEGQDLKQILLQQGRLPPSAVVDLVRVMADALDALHDQGLLHRDIKPANIVQRTSDSEYVLVDLGLVRDWDQETLTRSQELLGTPLYLPPEAFSGEPWEDPGDQYQLGAVAFEAVTGQPLVPGDTIEAILSNVQLGGSLEWGDASVGGAFKRVIARATAPHSKQRFPDCEAFAQALQEAHPEPEAIRSSETPGSIHGLGSSPARRRRQASLSGRRPVAVAMTLGFLLAILILWFGGGHRDSRSATPTSNESSSIEDLSYLQDAQRSFVQLLSRIDAGEERRFDLDPMAWPAVLRRLPELEEARRRLAVLPQTELSERARSLIRELDGDFDALGLPRPYFPRGSPAPGSPTIRFSELERISRLPIRPAPPDRRTFRGHAGLALRRLEDLLSMVELRDREVRQLGRGETLPGFALGLSQSFSEPQSTLSRFCGNTMELRSNRLHYTRLLRRELEQFDLFLLAGGRALQGESAESDLLSLIFFRGLQTLWALRFAPSTQASISYLIPERVPSAGAALVRALLWNMSRSGQRHIGLPGRPGAAELEQIRSALLPGVGIPARERRSLAVKMLLRWHEGQGDQQALLRALPGIRRIAGEIGPEVLEDLGQLQERFPQDYLLPPPSVVTTPIQSP